MVEGRTSFATRTGRARPADPLGVAHQGGRVSPRALHVAVVVRLERAHLAAPALPARQPELVH